MDQHELLLNIQILEHLGWFIAEDETDEDTKQFDTVLQCCRPDGTILERVPISDFLLSIYAEEDGSLEGRLWFFAPKYSTSLCNLTALLDEDNLIEWETSKTYYLDIVHYHAEVTALGASDDGEIYETSWGRSYSEKSSSIALAAAYLSCVGVKPVCE